MNQFFKERKKDGKGKQKRKKEIQKETKTKSFRRLNEKIQINKK